jgi:hypothetical protein
MKTEVEKLNPSKAAQYLKRNIDNRPIRRTVVENLKAAWQRGEYILSHQGVAFDTQNNLVDGQHRLTALSEMPPNFTIEMLVVRGLHPDAKKVMDIGYKRTASDILGEDRKLVETARFLAAVYLGRVNAVTPQYMAPFVERIRDIHHDLIDFCPTSCKMWSSAPMRAAAVMTGMSGGDMDYTKLVYRALVAKDFTTMPGSAQSIFRAHMSGKVRASNATDAFVRGLKIFNPANANLTKIQIKDTGPALDAVRAVLRQEVFGAKSGHHKAHGSGPVSEAKIKSAPPARVYALSGV